MKKIDKRRITKKAIEANIKGQTVSGDYIAEIDGVKMLVVYRKENRYDIFCPATTKDDEDANRIDVYFEDEESPSRYSESPDKTIRF